VKKVPLIYDKAMHEALKYWRDRLESMFFDGHIALDRPRPKDGNQQLSSIEQELDEEVNILLQRLTAGNHFILYTTLVLTLKICLYKYTGEPEVTIFSPATSEGIITNLLPIKSTLNADASFKDALLITKELLSGAYKNQQYPFSRMLLNIPEKRRPKRLFIVVAMAGFNERIPDGEYDMVVLFETVESKIKVTFRFDSGLYDESTIRHFFKLFNSILRQGLSRMAIRLADLRLDNADGSDSLDEVEDFASVATTSGITNLAGFETERLHRLIETQAARHPKNVAVTEGARITTYETLNRHAEQLAETLKNLGLDVRKPIVILMDAGTEMIVSMLAVMKIGAAFAPIKMLSIRKPINEILQALDAECVICQDGHLAELQQFRDSLTGIEHCVTVKYSASTNGKGVSSLEIVPNRSIFAPDAAAGEPASAEPARDVEQQISVSAGVEAIKRKSASVIDNTGSKVEDDERFSTACVLIDGDDDSLVKSAVSHAELVSLFQWLNERCEVSAQDRCLLSPSLGSSEQLYDTLGMLIAGASVEIANASSLKDLLAERITVWDLPTPLMQNLLAELLALHAEGKNPEGPRNILLSGEKQCVILADKLKQCFPNTRITGLYSNSAIGIWTTFFPFEDDPAESDYAVISQSIPGFEHRVLNKNGEPVPFYTKGELHLRRLLQISESAAEQDVKTGLRVKRLEDNRLSWLRGEEHSFVKYDCCVELTKVETILCQHEYIRAAEVITIKTGQKADTRVVAFIIAEPEQVSAESARDFLVLRDDIHLIPDLLILQDEFPLMPNGAIDREVLIKHFVTSHESKSAASSVESDDIRRRLKAVWIDILQVDDVDDDESFFAQGGNSLMATLLITRISDEFAVDLSVQNFFRKPTLRAIAQLIEAESETVRNGHRVSDFKAVSREKYRVQLSETDS
jgi:non-ribosomal peptide synthetase component F/acyl carrier protein